MPILHREKTVQLETEEVDIDVSNDPMRAIIPGRGPYIVKGSTFRIAIPFTGEAGLFKYGTAPYPYINPIVGDVEDDHVILSFQTDKPDAARIKADFDGRAAQIEEVLKMARGRTEEWNRELANIVPQKLKARREKLEQAGAISIGFPCLRLFIRPNSIARRKHMTLSCRTRRRTRIRSRVRSTKPSPARGSISVWRFLIGRWGFLG